MKSLLAISWEFPPMYGPRGTQVARTLGALTAFGWHSTVICLAPRRGGPHWRDGIEANVPEGVDLVRVTSPEEWTIVRAARRLLPAWNTTPDPHALWIDRATAAAEVALSSDRFDGMVTFAQPWSDHVVGLKVRRARRIPWVAHFSDPWVDSVYWTGSAAQREAAVKMEHDVISQAEGVVFVTEQASRLVMQKFPADWSGKVGVVPHGFERSEAPPAVPRVPGPLRLIYTGRFYEGLRAPDATLRALAAMHAQQSLQGRFELTFVGPFMENIERMSRSLGLDGVVRFHDRVSPAEAQAMAAAADVLLVIDAPSTGPSPFLPSKLVDYLPFAKPMLGFTPLSGASAALLKRLGCPVAEPLDEQGIRAACTELLRSAEAGTLRLSPQFQNVAAEYDIMRTTSGFNDVLTRAFNVRAS